MILANDAVGNRLALQKRKKEKKKKKAILRYGIIPKSCAGGIMAGAPSDSINNN